MMDQFSISAREAADRLYTMRNQASLTVADLSRGIGQVLGSAKAAGQRHRECPVLLTSEIFAALADSANPLGLRDTVDTEVDPPLRLGRAVISVPSVVIMAVACN